MDRGLHFAPGPRSVENDLVGSRDIKTRYQGVYVRHRKGCPANEDARCRCTPAYFGVVYDRRIKRTVKTKRMTTADAARNARADLTAALDRGETRTGGNLRLTEARERFISAAREGKALNKHGRRYKPRAVDDIEEVLRVHIEPGLGTKRLTGIRRGEIQEIVDELAPRLSGSRIRSTVNALRSLYRWAQDRELVQHDPAALVRLPAMNATRIERVATPAEFAELIASVPLDIGVPYALAGYGMGRRAQIIHLRWTDVDLERGALEWGVEWEARKYDASRRVVPIAQPLTTLLRRRYLELGRPTRDSLVCPPHAAWATTMRLNTGWLATRANKIWETANLEPITLQESRHTAATWLDAAGVRPKVASVLMGHSIPERQPGAAAITLARYTHALPEDIERARDQINRYFADRQTSPARRSTEP
jgi:integrase